MSSVKKLEAQIKKKKEIIANKLNELIDLKYELGLKGAKKIYEEDREIGRGKNKRSHRIKIMMWHEFFHDEDTGDSVKIDRHRIIEVDGEKSDGWDKITYWKPEQIK